MSLISSLLLALLQRVKDSSDYVESACDTTPSSKGFRFRAVRLIRKLASTPERRRQKQQEQRQKEQEENMRRSPLMSLPTQLIQEIAAELPPAPRAALTLTVSYMCYVAGTRPWELLREDENERTDFFSLINDFWPRYQQCAYCKNLRTVSLRDGPSDDHIDTHTDYCKDSYEQVTLPLPFFLSYTIRIHHVEAVLKRYRLGSEHGLPLNVFRRNEISDGYGDYVFSYKTCAQIVRGELLVGMRTRLFRPGLQDFPYGVVQRLGSVCPHDTVYITTEQLFKTIQCKVAHHMLNEAQCDGCRGLKHCRFCWTEYYVEIVNHGADDGVELVLDIWKNLGSGQSPKDPKWRKQSWWHWKGKHDERAEHTCGDIRSALDSFEESMSASFAQRPSFNLVLDYEGRRTYRRTNPRRGTFCPSQTFTWKDERWQAHRSTASSRCFSRGAL